MSKSGTSASVGRTNTDLGRPERDTIGDKRNHPAVVLMSSWLNLPQAEHLEAQLAATDVIHHVFPNGSVTPQLRP
jgi:hypothetical protein